MNEISCMQRISARLLLLLLIAIFCDGTTAGSTYRVSSGVLVAISFVAFPASLAFSFSSCHPSGWISHIIQRRAHRHHPKASTGKSSIGYGRQSREAWGSKKNGSSPLLSSKIALTLTLNDDLDEMDITTSKSRRSNQNDVDSTTWKERSKRWILLVDDEIDICKAVGDFLFEQGYQVTTCTNAPTALEIIQRGGYTKRSIYRPRRRPVPQTCYQDFLETEVKEEEQDSDDSSGQVEVVRFRPDIIVSDVRMPEMDGIELLTTLRADANLLGIPVVLLTAKSQTQDRIAGYNAGADAYIPKPFDPEELVTIVDNVVARYEQAAAASDDLIWMTNSRGEVVATTAAAAAADVSVEELQRDLAEIKYLLLEKGGGGVGVAGFVQATKVFLAPDEQELLELLCLGLMNKEIAAKMYLSTRRVQQLLTELFRKTNVKNRTELVRWAINTGNVQI